MFNKNGRLNNSAKASMSGVAFQIANLVMQFAYRTIFLMVLSVEYLGLNSLFTNIIGLLSLADLGIGVTIVYRMYDPISKDDVGKVAAIMKFYKNIYLAIGSIVTIIGLAIMPFIKFFINDAATIPADVNIYVIYLLFLVQSLSSYLFSYKHALLTVDQRQSELSLSKLVATVLQYATMIAVILTTKNFMLTLYANISISITSNYIISFFVTKKYKAVFSKANTLDKATQKAIFKDTYALMCHKVGTVVLGSTDSIVISAFLGLTVLGVYSNYLLIFSAVMVLFSQIVIAATASVGNLHAKESMEKIRDIYYKINYLNLFIASFCTICLYSLSSSFVVQWLGRDMVIDNNIVILLTVNFFISFKNCNGAFINAAGLFVKDKIRPLIEATLNLTISLVLVRLIGLMGIILGTIISMLLTVFWREPYILFKHDLKMSRKKYWAIFMYFAIVTAITSFFVAFVVNLIPEGWGYLFVKFGIAITMTTVILLLSTLWMKETKYYLNLVKRIIKR